MERPIEESYIQSIMHQSIVVVFGLPGSGKSFFAEKLAEVLGASYFSSDQLRATLFSEKNYSLEAKEEVYRKMLGLANSALESGNDVVLDGTFYLKKWRDMVTENFKNLASCHFIEIQASEALIKERTSKRRPFSDANFIVYKQLRKAFEPMQEDHLEIVSTNSNIGEMIKTTLNYLQLKKREQWKPRRLDYC
ncbi:MAG: ATP-binding protein [Ekhidna sp.]